MILSINSNPGNGGYCCFFSHNDKNYYADLCEVPFFKMKCMIFECDENHKINWDPVYVETPADITRQSLEECIVKFLAHET